MSDDCLKVTAHLASPLAGPAPQLDALLEWAMSLHHHKGNHERWKVDRRFPAPPQGEISIPVMRQRIGGWAVACCSSPILPRTVTTIVEHITKRIDVEHADLLAPTERKVINTTGFWTKSYRLPLEVRRVERVVWFARGYRKNLLKALKRVQAIGQRPAKGYGVVANWSVETGAPAAWWWWENVLMRPLPYCDELPEGLTGYRRDYGACTAPFWHQDRWCDIVEPC